MDGGCARSFDGARRSQPAARVPNAWINPLWQGDLGPRLRGDDASGTRDSNPERHSRGGGNPRHASSGWTRSASCRLRVRQRDGAHRRPSTDARGGVCGRLLGPGYFAVDHSWWRCTPPSVIRPEREARRAETQGIGRDCRGEPACPRACPEGRTTAGVRGRPSTRSGRGWWVLQPPPPTPW